MHFNRSIPQYLFTSCIALAAASLIAVDSTQRALAANQTSTASPVIVGGNRPYQLQVRRVNNVAYDRPSVHSFVAGEYDGQWVVLGGLTNGLHGFDIDNDTIPGEKQLTDLWVIDPHSGMSWNRSLKPGEANSGLNEQQYLSLVTANAQFEQVGDRLYVTGGFGDDLISDPASRDTFDTLTALDLPGLVDWAKGGAGQAVDHIRQVQDDWFKVTGGSMHHVDGKMHLVFGQDFNQPYNGNRVNGIYTHQVRTFTIDDDGTSLSFTPVQTSGDEASNPEFRRRDLNVYPTLRDDGGTLSPGLTALSGVFTLTRGAWTVPVEIDADGNAVQVDGGLDSINSDGMLDATTAVFKQGMNNYHSAKAGLFSAADGSMHEILFGGITLQEYDPTNPAADANGFVTDANLPNTHQISAVIRNAAGEYQQHYLGAFPELYDGENKLLRFGSNAEFFPEEGIPRYENGVIDLDALAGETVIGHIFGGLVINEPHAFNNPSAVTAASGELFEVVLIMVPEPGSLTLAASLAAALAYYRRTRARKSSKR